MNKVFVNYASTGREYYTIGQDRLIHQLHSPEVNWDGDYLFASPDYRYTEEVRIDDYPVRPHKQVPYGFKIDLIDIALQKGYKQIIWGDSTIMPQKNLDGLFEKAKDSGIVAFHNLGHDLHRYISDFAAAKLKILDLPEFEMIPQIMACSIVFDFNLPITQRIFKEWKEASQTVGMFQDGGSARHEFRAHRHDQAILSALLYLHSVELYPYGLLVYEPHDKTKEYGDDIYLLNKGL